NCSTGPEPMADPLRALAEITDRPVSVLPNAGLPTEIDGRAVYPMEPVPFAEAVASFVDRFGVQVVGGCCGTTPEHLHELVQRVHGVQARERAPVNEPALTSLHSTVGLRQEPRPLLVGERTNTNGSRKFKQLLEAEDWHKLVDM